jgi:lysophospholipase L1-like esterase
MNYGDVAMAMLKNAIRSYWQSAKYDEALHSAPDLVFIMLGTNDAKDINWQPHAREYEPDYMELIRSFLRLKSRPRVYAVVPPPLYADGMYGMNATVVNRLLPPLIKHIAESAGLPPAVDVFSAFAAHCPELPPAAGKECDWMQGGEPTVGDDGVHPNDAGYIQVARLVREAIMQTTSTQTTSTTTSTHTTSTTTTTTELLLYRLLAGRVTDPVVLSGSAIGIVGALVGLCVSIVAWRTQCKASAISLTSARSSLAE